MSDALQVTGKIMKYELRDVARSRWLFAYTAFFLLVTDALLRFSDGGGKALLSLMNVVLIIIPLAGADARYDGRRLRPRKRSGRAVARNRGAP